MAPSQLLHGCMTAFRADTGVEVPDCFQKLCHGHIGITLSEAQPALDPADYFQVLRFHAVVQKSIVTDLLETAGSTCIR